MKTTNETPEEPGGENPVPADGARRSVTSEVVPPVVRLETESDGDEDVSVEACPLPFSEMALAYQLLRKRRVRTDNGGPRATGASDA